MSCDRYQIVKYRPEFKKLLLKLQKKLWGQNFKQRATYFNWKYGENPYSDEIFIYLAFFENNLVGMVGAYGIQWEYGEPRKVFTGLCFADLIILPEHRHFNLFPKLMTYAIEDLSKTNHTYVFDLSAASHVAMALLMQGWRRIYIQTAHRENNPITKSGQNLDQKKKIFGLVFTLNKLRSYLFKIPGGPSLYLKQKRLLKKIYSIYLRQQTASLSEIERKKPQFLQKSIPFVSLNNTARPEAMAELVKRNSYENRIRQVRDQLYFKWRYQNPLSNYQFLFWENGRLDGFLVLYTKYSKYPAQTSVYVVDWEVAHEQAWRDLFQAVIQWTNFKDIYIWTEGLSEIMRKTLREAGFVFIDETGNTFTDIQRANIFVKSLANKKNKSNPFPEEKVLLNKNNWDLRMIYSDAF